jgi:hypothetical protein
MIILVSEMRINKHILTSLVPLAIILIAAFAVTTVPIRTVSESSQCLLGSYVLYKDDIINQTVLLSTARINISQVTENVLTIDVSVGVESNNTSYQVEAGLPLTDIYVETDEGAFRWSDGKAFIMIVMNVSTPFSDHLEMNVTGKCVHYVRIEIKAFNITLELSSSAFPITDEDYGNTMQEWKYYAVELPCKLTLGNETMAVNVEKIELIIKAPSYMSVDDIRVLLMPYEYMCNLRPLPVDLRSLVYPPPTTTYTIASVSETTITSATSCVNCVFGVTTEKETLSEGVAGAIIIEEIGEEQAQRYLTTQPSATIFEETVNIAIAAGIAIIATIAAYYIINRYV